MLQQIQVKRTILNFVGMVICNP
uniref:Uncharacterized protein n=1 Tax=Rhizophora mucronata TaxID=61149 RepID=A0A2P2QYH5_RHIMU